MRFLVFLLLFGVLEAGSVRLVNNTAYKLRAIIRAGDGTYLGEVLVNSQQTMSWNDYTGSVGYPNTSQTPYTVLWYCNDGDGTPFGVCDGVGPGATVAAMTCSGTRACKPKKKPQNPPPYGQPPEENLQKQLEKDAGPPEGALQ